MLQSLPDPNFESCITISDLLFEVIHEMQRTNYLEDYFERTERTAKITLLWGLRSSEIYDEAMNKWNMSKSTE